MSGTKVACDLYKNGKKCTVREQKDWYNAQSWLHFWLGLLLEDAVIILKPLVTMRKIKYLDSRGQVQVRWILIAITGQQVWNDCLWCMTVHDCVWRCMRGRLKEYDGLGSKQEYILFFSKENQAFILV